MMKDEEGDAAANHQRENRQRLTATHQRPQKFVPSYNLLLYTGGTVGPALCHAEVTPATASVYARQKHRTTASKKLYLASILMNHLNLASYADAYLAVIVLTVRSTKSLYHGIAY